QQTLICFGHFLKLIEILCRNQVTRLDRRYSHHDANHQENARAYEHQIAPCAAPARQEEIGKEHRNENQTNAADKNDKKDEDAQQDELSKMKGAGTSAFGNKQRGETKR